MSSTAFFRQLCQIGLHTLSHHRQLTIKMTTETQKLHN